MLSMPQTLGGMRSQSRWMTSMITPDVRNTRPRAHSVNARGCPSSLRTSSFQRSKVSCSQGSDSSSPERSISRSFS